MRALLLILALTAAAQDDPQIIDCVFPDTCSNEPPVTRFDFPTCADIEAGSRLEAALAKGDLSVLDEVRQRYERAFTYRERHHLGGLLLDHLDDDTTVWNDLSGEASVCVRFAPESDELAFRAKLQDVDPAQLWWRSYDALTAIAHQPRARYLLHQALASGEAALHPVAVFGLAMQKDVPALGAIAAALERLGAGAGEAAMNLVHYESGEADALAMKYLDEEQREQYLYVREYEP